MSYRVLPVVVLVVAAVLPLEAARVVTAAGSGPTITAIATGYGHTCALTSAGGVKCWGYNGQGQLGNGTTVGSLVPVDVKGLASGVSAITVGGATCALTGSGGVKCWGDNSFGGLGNGMTTDSRVPVDVSGLTSGVSSISAGSAHTCAVTKTGGAKCWGYNNHGQLGNGTTDDSGVPVDVSGLTIGVSAISAGYKHTCALMSSGGVKCWGSNFAGELGSAAPFESSVPVDVVGLANNVGAISAAGISHSCALMSGGGVKCWGSNVAGELGDGTTADSLGPVSSLASGVTAIATGDSHTCALRSGGGVECWGANEAGQLGSGKSTASGIPDPTDVEGLSTSVTAIAAGGAHTCALTSGGTVKCWGDNANGALGDGTKTNRSVPVGVAFASQEPPSTTWTARMGIYGVATLRVGSPDHLVISFKRFRPYAAYVVTLRRGNCQLPGRLVLSGAVTTTRYGTASRRFTLTSAQKSLASLPLALRFGTKCAPFATPMATPTPASTPTPTFMPTPTPTPRPTPKTTTLPVIALNTPTAGATIVQNDPSTGCSPDANRGYGFIVRFEWTAPLGQGLVQYELAVQHTGSDFPALDVRVADANFTWTDCAFVVDRNRADWHWQVTALNGDQQAIAASDKRAISFLPCRLADGTTPCSAPG